MLESDVILREDNRRYRLDKPLGAGLIGAVYKGVGIDNPNELIAVKVPAQNLTPQQRERFNSEHKLLADLATRLGDSPTVPCVWKGTGQSSKQEVILLEYIPEETSLADQVQAQLTWEAREKLALIAAEHYAQLLAALHALGKSCPDRKLADVRWIPETQRLVVLDWNVTAEGGTGVADDLYLFGSLWFQLLARHYPVPDPDPLDDRLWSPGQSLPETIPPNAKPLSPSSEVSLGTRFLIARALAANPTRRYPNADELRRAVQGRRSDFNRPPVELWREGEAKFKTLSRLDREARTGQETVKGIQASDLPSVGFQDERRALDLLDLAWRLGYQASGETILREAAELLQTQPERLVQTAQHNIGIGQYDTAHEILTWATGVADQAGPDAPVFRLRVKRWQLLLELGRKAMEAHMFGMGGEAGYRKRLVKLIQQLEKTSSAGQDSLTDMRQLQEDLKKLVDEISADRTATLEVRQLVGEFLAEANGHLQLAEAERQMEAAQAALTLSAKQPAYDQAARQYRQAGDAFSHVSLYRAELENTLSPPEQLAVQAQDRAGWARLLGQLQQQAQSAMGLGDWIAIRAALREIEAAIGHLAGIADLAQLIEPDKNKLLRLILGEELKQTGDWRTYIRAAGELLQDVETQALAWEMIDKAEAEADRQQAKFGRSDDLILAEGLLAELDDIFSPKTVEVLERQK